MNEQPTEGGKGAQKSDSLQGEVEQFSGSGQGEETSICFRSVRPCELEHREQKVFGPTALHLCVCVEMLIHRIEPRLFRGKRLSL